MDLSSGILASGGLSQSEVDFARKIGGPDTARSREKTVRSVAAVVVVALLLFILLLLQDKNPNRRAPPQRIDPRAQAPLFWLLGGAAAWTVFIAALVLREKRARRRDRGLEPHTCVFQEERFYVLDSDSLHVLDWNKFRLRKSTDLLALVLDNGLAMHVLPRRFFRDDVLWQAFCELTERKLQTVAKTGDLAQTTAASADDKAFSFLDEWKGIDFTAPAIICSADQVRAQDAALIFDRWRIFFPYWCLLTVLTLGATLAALLTSPQPRLHALCGGAAIGCASILAFFIWAPFLQRRRLRQQIQDAGPGTWGIHDQFVEACSATQRSIYPWKRLTRAPGTGDLVDLIVGDMKLRIALPRRVFCENDWNQLIDRVKSLPEFTGSKTGTRWLS
ncbi:MAG TPA: hypothetical protein VHV55_07805 [Pirellulales bacterium]|nr:hypothetical protein [Pirellulales bacterium]